MKIRIDGTLIELKGEDLDGDGKVDKFTPEVISRSMHNEIDVKEPTELGESLRELNDDTVDGQSRMSGIDMRARLGAFEIPSIVAVDTLVGFNFLPVKCSIITRSKKRNSVSIDGKGRDDIVQIVGGRQDHEERKQGGVTSFMMPQNQQ